MASAVTRFWLKCVTLIEALAAFFAGVFFSVWGDDLTSPPWLLIMDGWHSGRFWGTILLISGALFLFGLDWDRNWLSVIGCGISGVVYCVMAIYLSVTPFIREDALSGSIGMWWLGGALTLCLAGFMNSERHHEIMEKKAKQ